MMSLDQYFFTDILRKYEKDPNITVENVLKNKACEDGNNFIAVVSRVTLKGVKNFKDCQWSVIVKELPTECLFDAKKAFSNEVYAYKKILPTLRQYIRKPLNFPKCLYASESLIILEDLSVDGFTNVDKRVGLNYEQIQNVLKELARLHAASIILNHKNPEIFQEISTKVEDLMFGNEILPVMETQEWNLDKAILLSEDIIDKNVNYQLEMIEILKDLKGRTFELQKEALRAPRKYKVINHGDCWCNNILVKGNKTKLIDFQLMRTTSVGADLSYLLYINMEPSFRISKEKELLNLYLCELNSCLELSEVNIQMSKTWLDSEMNDFVLYGYLHGMWLLPLFLDKDMPEMKNKSLQDTGAAIKERILMFSHDYVNKVTQNGHRINNNNIY